MLKFYIKTPEEINPETDYLISLYNHYHTNEVDLGRIRKISSVEKQILTRESDEIDSNFLINLYNSDNKKLVSKTELIVTYLVTFEDGNFQRYNEKQVLMIGVKNEH
ncbi:MAG TPA: hypothetical protein PLH46_06445 [Caldisericia bacterium]|nr:hypothetical protein [Caldisericia bacterium]